MDAYRRIQTGKTGDVHLVVFKDKKILDDTTLDEIKKEIAALLGKATGPDVLLDFGNVEFMSSAMLGLLGQLHRKISSGHGRLKMCGIRPEILTVFKITNLDKLFSIHKDAPTALATFTGTNSASTAVLDLGSLPMLDNAPTAYLRITFDGATASNGHNRLDNVLVTGNSSVPAPGAIALLACAGGLGSRRRRR